VCVRHGEFFTITHEFRIFLTCIFEGHRTERRDSHYALEKKIVAHLTAHHIAWKIWGRHCICCSLSVEVTRIHCKWWMTVEVLCLWSFVPAALRMGSTWWGFRELERSKYQPPATVRTIREVSLHPHPPNFSGLFKLCMRLCLISHTMLCCKVHPLSKVSEALFCNGWNHYPSAAVIPLSTTALWT